MINFYRAEGMCLLLGTGVSVSVILVKIIFQLFNQI